MGGGVDIAGPRNSDVHLRCTSFENEERTLLASEDRECRSMNENSLSLGRCSNKVKNKKLHTMVSPSEGSTELWMKSPCQKREKKGDF